MLWRELESARASAGAKLGLEILPLPVGDRGERDLADLFVAARSRGPAEVETLVRQVRHAIAMAAAETVAGEKTPEWFTGAVFSPNNFRRLVAKQPARVIAPAPARARRRPTEQPRCPDPSPEELAESAAIARAALARGFTLADGARAPPTSAAIADEQQPQPAKAAT
jgi:plasmid stabilization system protein ParE